MKPPVALHCRVSLLILGVVICRSDQKSVRCSDE